MTDEQIEAIGRQSMGCDPGLAGIDFARAIEQACQAPDALRDHFAAKALGGLCANPGGPFQACDRSGWSLTNCTIDQVAETAYALASAMLKARAALATQKD